MTELHMVPQTPTPDLPSGVTHRPSTPPTPIVVLKALIGGVEQTWYVYGDDDEDVAHKLPRVHRYIQELRKKFGGEEITPATPTPGTPPPLEEREDWCPIHHVAMVKQSNDRGSWYSHRVPGEGFCKGKRKRAGA